MDDARGGGGGNNTVCLFIRLCLGMYDCGCLSACLCRRVYLPTFVCLSIYLLYLSICLCVCVSVCLCVDLFTVRYVAVYLSMSICVSIHLFIRLFYPYICLRT